MCHTDFSTGTLSQNPSQRTRRRRSQPRRPMLRRRRMMKRAAMTNRSCDGVVAWQDSGMDTYTRVLLAMVALFSY